MTLRPTAQIILLATIFAIITAFIFQVPRAVGQSESPPATIEEDGESQGPAEYALAAPLPFSGETVEINWGEKLAEGGNTIIVLLILSVTGVASFAERLLALRTRHVAPSGLANDILPRLLARDYDGVKAACQERPSTLSRIIVFVVEHRENPVETVSAGVNDIAGREVRTMLARTSPLAVVASLAPLLGLLGTMIGMIEAFELVSVYGDDGGASMLAGSIAKALITTAVGLMIAIPAVAAYQFVKHRVNHLTNALEIDTETIINQLYLKKQGSTDTETD